MDYETTLQEIAKADTFGDTNIHQQQFFKADAVQPFEEKMARYYLHNLLGRHQYTQEFVSTLRRYINMDSVNTKLKNSIQGLSEDSALAIETGTTISSSESEFFSILDFAKNHEKMDTVDTIVKKELDDPEEALEAIKKIPAYRNISKFFQLEDSELSILVFMDLAEKTLGNLYSTWKDDFLFTAISLCTTISLKEVQRCLKVDSILIETEILKVSDGYDAGYLTNKALLEIFSVEDSFYSSIKEIDNKEFNKLKNFIASPHLLEISKFLMVSNKGAQLLANGTSSKKLLQFAHYLTASTKNKSYVFNANHSLFTHLESNTIANLLRATISLVETDSIIIVLATERIEQSSKRETITAIKKISKQRKTRIVWLMPGHYEVCENLLRIMDLTIDLGDIDKETVTQYYKEKLSNLAINEKTKRSIIRLLLNTPPLRRRFKKICNFISFLKKKNLSEETTNTYIFSFLAAQEKILRRSIMRMQRTDFFTESEMEIKHAQKPMKITPHYSIEVLETSIKAPRILTSMRNIISLSQNGKDPIDYKVLFYGPPGTGKTAFAHHLAKALGKDLVVYRYSDIANAFLGNTEKNIARLFNSTDHLDSILLMDEIDSFLFKRGNAVHAWEVSQVNEFLTQMDQYQGIFIATTNNLNLIDDAVIRRFQQKVEFYALSSKGFRILLETYFPNTNFSELDIADLLDHGPYVPSDFQIAEKNLLALDPEEATKEFIKDALINEARLRIPTKQRSIGFTA